MHLVMIQYYEKDVTLKNILNELKENVIYKKQFISLFTGQVFDFDDINGIINELKKDPESIIQSIFVFKNIEYSLKISKVTDTNKYKVKIFVESIDKEAFEFFDRLYEMK